MTRSSSAGASHGTVEVLGIVNDTLVGVRLGSHVLRVIRVKGLESSSGINKATSTQLVVNRHLTCIRNTRNK